MYQENSLQVFAEAIIGGFDMKRKTASMQPKVEIALGKYGTPQ